MKTESKIQLLVIICAAGAFLFAGYVVFTFVLNVRSSVRQMETDSKIKQITLAMLSHHDKHGSYPPAAIRDKNGKPLLSWRVIILQYMEHENLYKQFRLDEPWDSPHNKKLLAKMPAVYRQSTQSAASTETHYQVFVGPGTAFEREGLKISEDFDEGGSKTINVVEVNDTVPWTKPQDLIYDPKKPLPTFYADPKDESWWWHLTAGDADRSFVAGGVDGNIRSFLYRGEEEKIRTFIQRK